MYDRYALPMFAFHAILVVFCLWWSSNSIAYLMTMLSHIHVEKLYIGLESLFSLVTIVVLCIMFALLGGVFNPILNNTVYYFLNIVLAQQLLAGTLFLFSVGWDWNTRAIITLKGLSSLVVFPVLLLMYYRIAQSTQRERAYQAGLAASRGYK